MHLKDLIDQAGLSVTTNAHLADKTTITGITSDSREVKKGYLFAALPGTKVDGRDYIDAAITAGAEALLVPKGTKITAPHLAVIEDDNPRRAFTLLAAGFFNKQPENIVAVTGTNGKTSTVNFCRQIWQAMDHAAASLGTIGIIAPGFERSGSLTTPDPVTLYAEIAELEAAGVTHLALEASSHGLAQNRLDGLRIQAAGFTNLTRDHLDYHGSMEAYFEAKARLFTEVMQPDGIAVLNADSDAFAELKKLAEKSGKRVIDYGRKAKDIVIRNRKPLPHGQFLELDVMGERYTLELPLVGAFQAMNALCAAGLVIAADADNKLLQMQVMHTLERLQGVRGRLELAATHPCGAPIYVDYAHTPDALDVVLDALRPHTENRLHALIGCGGDRDRGKRPLMGEIAAKKSDIVIVTDDNPRSEDPATIRKDVMAGCPDALEIDGRMEAIRTAVKNLKTGDVLVISGKGHEQGQIIKDKIIPFDDVKAAIDAVTEVKA